MLETAAEIEAEIEVVDTEVVDTAAADTEAADTEVQVIPVSEARLRCLLRASHICNRLCRQINHCHNPHTMPYQTPLVA